MLIKQVIQQLEQLAPPTYQEAYDNSGLITGDANWPLKGVIVCVDAIEQVIEEAIAKGCNMVVAHHPIIFSGLKKINGKNYVEKAIITAIKNDVAIYAIHTNLDNVINGVNGKIASLLGLQNTKVLDAKPGILKKLYTFVPVAHLETVRNALFSAGAGHIGNYSECSFGTQGYGTFKAGNNTSPFVGETGKRHTEAEVKLEIVFPAWLQGTLIKALQSAHPYQEAAYDVVALANNYEQVGSGIMGNLPQPVTTSQLLSLLKKIFSVPVIKHTMPLKNMVEKIAVCGGAGSFLINKAIAAGADVFITADMKYHEFFDANGQIMIADVGHYESEQFTTDLLADVLLEKFPTFAVLKTSVNTNPVHYTLE
jgi:dinuclear metal center YbgI/SA1388 family protein